MDSFCGGGDGGDARAVAWLVGVGMGGCGYVLAAEAFNSAIEALSDRVSPGYDEAVRRTKDLAAGGVLLTAVAAFVVGLIVFVPKLIDLL